METVISKKKKSSLILLLLLIAFEMMFIVFGPGIYNDSDQYIKMHIHREPLYPLFLAALRAISGEHWLAGMGSIQNALAAISIWLFAEYMAGQFKLKDWEKLIIIGLGIAPHVLTKCFSALHLFISNSVMSEALCLPLFLWFMALCFKMYLADDRRIRRKVACASLVMAFLLSLIRSQMMTAILLWFVVMAAVLWLKPEPGSLKGRDNAAEPGSPGRREDTAGPGSPAIQGRPDRRGRILRILAAAAVVVLVFALRLLAVKSYNLVFNGHFINNTYGAVNTLTNILYAADREDGENIRDAQAREFFYRMYDLTEERQANYKYASGSLAEKAGHLEKWHDTIKYEMIEDVFYQTYDREVTGDYIQQNLMADETAGKIMAGILPSCFPRWFGNYLLIAAYGLIRSIMVVHPALNVVAALIYLSVPVLIYLLWKKERHHPAIPVMAISLLAVLANAAAVSLTIMCLSRYMIYGFTAFYTGYFLLLSACARAYGLFGTGSDSCLEGAG